MNQNLVGSVLGRNNKLEAQCAEPVSLTFHSALRKLNTEPSIGAFHQVSVHLAKQFQRRRFSEIDQSESPKPGPELPTPYVVVIFLFSVSDLM
jgi:hypothetical protein